MKIVKYCICGRQPDLRQHEQGWVIICPACKIKTEYSDLNDAIGIWNMFIKQIEAAIGKGIIEQGIAEETVGVNGTEKRINYRIKICRDRKGWTQAELAKKAGVSVPVISRMESKGIGVHISILLILAKALGVRLIDLFAEPSELDRARCGRWSGISIKQ